MPRALPIFEVPILLKSVLVHYFSVQKYIFLFTKEIINIFCIQFIKFVFDVFSFVNFRLHSLAFSGKKKSARFRTLSFN